MVNESIKNSQEKVDAKQDQAGDANQTDSGDMTIEPIPEANNRRREADRRANDRRRSARGLFEFRARRDGVDRRQLERRARSRFRLAFWRKTS